MKTEVILFQDTRRGGRREKADPEEVLALSKERVFHGNVFSRVTGLTEGLLKRRADKENGDFYGHFFNMVVGRAVKFVELCLWTHFRRYIPGGKKGLRDFSHHVPMMEVAFFPELFKLVVEKAAALRMYCHSNIHAQRPKWALGVPIEGFVRERKDGENLVRILLIGEPNHPLYSGVSLRGSILDYIERNEEDVRYRGLKRIIIAEGRYLPFTLGGEARQDRSGEELLGTSTMRILQLWREGYLE